MQNMIFTLLLSVSSVVSALPLDDGILDSRTTCTGTLSPVYNDTFPNPGGHGVIQGGGAKYVNWAVLDQRPSALVLAPPTSPYVLANQNNIQGLPVLAPKSGVLRLKDLRYACGLTSGGLVNPPGQCNIDVICESAKGGPAIVRSLAFDPTVQLLGAQQFGYATFPAAFTALTSCLFNLTSTSVGGVQAVALLLDNVAYQIEKY